MTEQPARKKTDRAVARFFGGLLMAVGGLIAVLCGGCTGWVGLMFLFDAMRSAARPDFNPATFSQAPLLLIVGVWVIVGVVPTLFGVGLFFWGRILRRGDGR